MFSGMGELRGDSWRRWCFFSGMFFTRVHKVEFLRKRGLGQEAEKDAVHSADVKDILVVLQKGL